MTAPVVRRISILPLTIPLRHQVEHAASSRATADPVVVAVELQNGVVGYGETLPRPYVTGESVESVIATVQSTFLANLMSFHPESFGAAIDALDALPWQSESETPVPAARAAVELALLDASMRTFDRGMEAVVRFLDLPKFAAPGSLPTIRFSGVLATSSIAKMRKMLRLMYWGGLRHFKLKVGFDGDAEFVRVASDYLAAAIANGKASLRVDANGGWSLEEAEAWVRETSSFPLASIEQPLAKTADSSLPRLKSAMHGQWGATAPLIMHDESLVTMEDAERLSEIGVADAFNIRISKCGGMLPSLRLADYAHRHDIGFQIGCMVGETSILSAAQVQLLSVCPDVRWAEGCFGSFLLSGDVVDKPLRFGFGGRPPGTRGGGFGVDVSIERLASLCETEPITLTL